MLQRNLKIAIAILFPLGFVYLLHFDLSSCCSRQVGDIEQITKTGCRAAGPGCRQPVVPDGVEAEVARHAYSDAQVHGAVADYSTAVCS